MAQEYTAASRSDLPPLTVIEPGSSGQDGFSAATVYGLAGGLTVCLVALVLIGGIIYLIYRVG